MTATKERVAAATITPPVAIQQKFRLLETTLRHEIVERDAVIESALLALIARMHLFMLGRPGVAKSRLVDLLATHISGLTRHDRFKTLMTPYTVPEEVFGPVSLQMLKEDRYVYMTDGYFPVAKFAFLDEIWNANSAILNAFLMATNEREFRNDGKLIKLPLHSMFCASNQLPQSDGLSAIYDRIQFKHEVKPIQEQDAFIEMLKLRWAKPVGEVISWDEIEQAHKAAQEVQVPDDILEAVNTIRMQLRQAKIEPTDRKFVDSIMIIQAKAWLEGKDVATIEDLTPLCHVYWTTPDEQQIVESTLLRLANPFDRRANDLIQILDQLSNETDLLSADADIDPFDKNQQAVEIHTATDRVKDDLVKLINDVEKNGRKSVKTEQARAQLRSVTERLMREMFLMNAQNMDMGIPEAK